MSDVVSTAWTVKGTGWVYKQKKIFSLQCSINLSSGDREENKQ